MRKYGITAEQAGDGSLDLVSLLRENKGEARPFAPGDRRPPAPARSPNERRTRR